MPLFYFVNMFVDFRPNFTNFERIAADKND